MLSRYNVYQVMVLQGRCTKVVFALVNRQVRQVLYKAIVQYQNSLMTSTFISNILTNYRSSSGKTADQTIC